MDKITSTGGSILDRIISKSGFSNLLSYLENLAPSDLQSLLLEVFRRKATKQNVGQVFKTYKNKYAFLGTSEMSQKEILEFGLLFFGVLPANIQPVEFSPIGPLGANSVLAKLSQNNILSGIRTGEVLGDPTVALGLEAARRRELLLAKNPTSDERVSLCTDHRLLRLQSFDPRLGFMQHFRCFGMCTAGRDVGHESFLIETATEHLEAYLNFIRALNQDGFSIKNVEVLFSDIRIAERLIEHCRPDRDIVQRNTQNPDFRFLEQCGLDIPSIFDRISRNDIDRFAGCDVQKSIDLLEKLDGRILDPLRQMYPEVRFAFDLGRVAGIGYYTDFCFHIFGETSHGLRLPLADGGLTDWTKSSCRARKRCSSRPGSARISSRRCSATL